MLPLLASEAVLLLARWEWLTWQLRYCHHPFPSQPLFLIVHVAVLLSSPLMLRSPGRNRILKSMCDLFSESVCWSTCGWCSPGDPIPPGHDACGLHLLFSHVMDSLYFYLKACVMCLSFSQVRSSL